RPAQLFHGPHDDAAIGREGLSQTPPRRHEIRLPLGVGPGKGPPLGAGASAEDILRWLGRRRRGSHARFVGGSDFARRARSHGSSHRASTQRGEVSTDMFDHLWVSDVWVDAVRDITLKGTLLLIFAALLALCLRRSSAAIRHRVWALAFVALLLLPL